MTLPDIDEGTYNDWAQQEFQRKAKERQNSPLGFLQNPFDQLGQAAGGVGAAIGGAASDFGASLDQQRQQLQAAISQGAPTAQAPPVQEAPPLAPPPPAAVAPPAPDQGAQFQQLQDVIGQHAQTLGQGVQDQGAQLQQLQAVIGQHAQTLNQPPFAQQPQVQPQGGGDLHAYARQAAQRAGVDPDIFERQIQQESGFNPNAGSSAGARGIAQIVPQYHPGVDTSDPYASLDYAANLMRSNVNRYGGDYSKALAAYNAGPGAVERYGGVPPFEETQRYLANILGAGGQKVRELAQGVGSALGMGRGDISQFGDAQLSNDEAYAACGPAAAVRFAQRFGRNPTLREATDLAATVGWTSGQGMAGIASEQALMNKLGVETTLVQGPQWERIAAEAQTGNPVTISTTGHYFYADGYNPQTGQYHVGRSGTDLRGGSEWMTADQMTSAMGPVQGALLASNPTVQAASTATGGSLFDQAIASARGGVDQGLQALRSAAEEGLGRGRAWADEQARNLDQAVSSAVQPGGGAEALGAMRALPTSPTVEAQLAGRENARLGIGPIGVDIPGQIAGPAGVVGEWLTERNPLTQASRFTTGQAQIQGADPAFQSLLSERDRLRDAALENPTPEAYAAYKDAEGRVTSYNDALIKGITPTAAYEAAFRAPGRVEEEGMAGLVGGIASMAIAPQGLASGTGRFLTSLALDPQGAPLNVAGEGLAKVGGTLARTFGRGAPQAGQAANIVESAANYPAGGLEDRFEQLARASAAASPDNLAHVDLRHADTPFVETLEPTVEGGGVASVHIPHLDEIRAMVENGLPFSQWYTGMAERAVDAIGGEHNLPEFATNFGITSQRTRVEDNLAESLRMHRIVREAAADAVARGMDPREAALKRLADMTTKAEGDIPGDVGGLAGAQKKTSIQNAYSQGGIASAGPKTPSYIGNFLSALNALYDPRTTNDTWVAQMFGVRGDTPLNRYANNDRAYRAAEVALNEIAREMGIPGHQAQAAAWYSMQRLREEAPDLFHSIGLEGRTTLDAKTGLPTAKPGFARDKGNEYKTGGSTLGDALKAAQERGIFEAASTGQEGAWALPKVQAELAKLAALPPEVREMTNPTGVDMMRRYKGKYKGPELVPSSPESRMAARVEAEAGAQTPTVQLPSLPLQELRDQGLLTDTGLLPALRNIPHRVQELADGSAAITLPGGNSDTARYVASVFGDALGADRMAITYPKFDAPSVGGIGVIVDPARLDEIIGQLQAQGVDALRGVDRGSIHVPMTEGNQALTAQISDTLANAGDAVKRSALYRGVAEHVDAGSFGENLRGAGPRFAPTGGVRPDLLERTRGVLRQAAGFGADAAALTERGSRPLRTQLTQGAIGGGIAGGYEASQEEGATPLDVAAGVAKGIPLGIARSVLPGSALRTTARLGAIAERTQGEGSVFDSPEVARLLDIARGRGVDPSELLQREIARLQNMPTHLSEGVSSRLENLQGALDELSRPARPAAEEVAAAAPEAARATEPVPGAPPSEQARTQAGNINLGKYVPEEVRDIIATVYDVNPDVMEAARRGVVPDSVVRELAEQVTDGDVNRITKLWNPGQAKNAETIYALRQSLANEGQNVLTAQRALRRNPASTDARLVLVQALTRMQAVQEVVSGVTAEAGRAVRQFREPINGESEMLRRLTKMAKAKDMTGEELAKHLADVDLEDPAAAIKLARDLNPATKWDKITALWYFNLLSSPTTHIRNITSNAVTAAMTPVESLGASVMDLPARGMIKAIGGETSGRQRFGGEALADVIGTGAGVKGGLQRALDGLTLGPTPERILSGEAAPEAWGGPLGKVIHAPGRALEAEDQFFKALNESAGGYRMAYRQALQEGVRGPQEVGQRMAEILKNPTPEFLEAMKQQGLYRTFQKESGLANSLVRARMDNPLLRYLMPFVRTPINIMKYSLERSPVGAAGIVGDFMTPAGRARLRVKGSGDLADRMSRATIGSAIMGGLGMYAYNGDNMTGAAPLDPTERDAFYRQGKQPYSFKSPTDGKWYSYQPLQPYGPLFAAAANIAKATKDDPQKGPRDWSNVALLAGLTAGQSLVDMPWTQGLNDALDLFSGRGPGGQDPLKAVENWTERQAGGLVPAAALLRSLARAQDDRIRDPQNPVQAMLAGIPFAQENVPVRRDVFGQSARRPTQGLGSLLNPFNPSAPTRDPLEQELARLQLRGYDVQPGFVGKSVDVAGQPVNLTDEQRRSYQETSGQLAYAVLHGIVGTSEWEALDDKERTQVVDRVVSNVRDLTRQTMTPELFDKAVESAVMESRRRGASPVYNAAPTAEAAAGG